MQITLAKPSHLKPAVDCLAAAFAEDPITEFLLQTGPDYPGRLRRFFSLLMEVRLARHMPVLLATEGLDVRGAAMGYTTERPTWPAQSSEDWETLGKGIPGFAERMSVYDAIAGKYQPQIPHYYLGAIGVDPAVRGSGIGCRLLQAFCSLSDSDQSSGGVYLETANPSNVRFYERAGFVTTGSGYLGSATIRCMFRSRVA